MSTLIKGLKEIVSLYEYNETNGLIDSEDEEFFCNNENGELELYLNKDSLDDIFVKLWINKFINEIKRFDNVSWEWDDTYNGAILKLPGGGSFAVGCWFDDNLCFGERDTISIMLIMGDNDKNLAKQISLLLQLEPKINKAQTARFEIEIDREDSFDKLIDIIGKLSELVNLIN